MRHDWTDSIPKYLNPLFLGSMIYTFFFPPDYKWIKITTNKTYTFYCFGLDYDYYDNPQPYFEDLFRELRSKKLNVRWTEDGGHYSYMNNEV